MITVQDAVKEILYKDADALTALKKGYINYSAYAKIIQKDVEKHCLKEVHMSTVMVALTRISKKIKPTDGILQNVQLENITTYAPLVEFAFIKNIQTIQEVVKLSTLFSTKQADFFTTIIGTTDITIICSQRLEMQVLKGMPEQPIIHSKNLAAIGIALDESYYPLPNITYSLLHRIAKEKIPLAETVTSHEEILFIFNAQYLAKILMLFPITETS